MANVENPYNTTLQNNLVVTSGINDAITVYFTLYPLVPSGNNSVTPTQVTIPKGSSLNDNNIELNITLHDLLGVSFYYLMNDSYPGGIEIEDIYNYKFTEDSGIDIYTEVVNITTTVSIEGQYTRYAAGTGMGFVAISPVKKNDDEFYAVWPIDQDIYSFTITTSRTKYISGIDVDGMPWDVQWTEDANDVVPMPMTAYVSQLSQGNFNIYINQNEGMYNQQITIYIDDE